MYPIPICAYFHFSAYIDSKHIFSHETDSMKRYYDFFPAQGIEYDSQNYIEKLRLETLRIILIILHEVPTLWFDKFAGHFRKGKQRKPILDLFKFDNRARTGRWPFFWNPLRPRFSEWR